ncbi:hypothetical protein J2Z81_000844 [Virgibacillus campisalis]|uniref:Uncharacterized protein n=1 Tax=Virgibacillus alimentarius TaxID=698769 RepID=A0ABS4S5X0_9BACI|nr:hypothetical protein [Virgibacillus alimentarius]
MIKHLFKATQVAPSPAFTGSIVRKRWLNLSAILIALKSSYIDSAALFFSQSIVI